LPLEKEAMQVNVIAFRAGVKIVNSDSIADSVSMVFQGGTITTNGIKFPGEIKQRDPKAPGYVY
jgi:hypothetical protein